MNGNLIDTRLGKYEIQAEVGRGGMGTVYQGYDPLLDRYVAVKVLAPHLVWEREFVERFLREARAAARLKHPSIVTIHDVGQEGGWHYFVMEYLEGQTLTEVIRQRGPLLPDEVFSILRPLAEALDYAHHRGLVHRDVKPANIIVDPAGQVTLTDFGIARAAQETRLTATGTIVGTPEYMSPEQVRGLTVGARSDQYSLAVVAYEMFSGRVPFEAESTLALLHKIAYDPPPPIRQARPDLPARVGGVLERGLAKEPGARYATASGFVKALGWTLAGEEVGEVVARPEEEPPLVEMPTKVVEPEAAAAPPPAMPPAPGPEVVAPPVEMPMERMEPEAAAAPPPAMPPAPGPEVVAPLVEMPMERMEPEAAAAPPPAMPPAPGPEVIAPPMPERGRTKVMPDVQPAVPFARRVPMWVWELGGLAVLVVVVIFFLSLTSLPSLTSSSTLFVSDREGKREIYRLAEAGEVVRVTYTSGDGESWSPAPEAGDSLLFTSDREGKREVYRIPGSGEVVQVTYTPGDGESWSPIPEAGGGILFTSDREGKREIYRIPGMPS